MSSAVRTVGFVCLPDRQLDLFSEVTRQGGYRPELVIDSNPGACAFKMAEILEIPASADLTLLRRFPCDVLVLPDDRPDLRLDVAELLVDARSEILTCSEMAREMGVDLDGSDDGAGPAGLVPERSWSLPLTRPAEADAPAADTSGPLLTPERGTASLDIERHPLESLEQPGMDDRPAAGSDANGSGAPAMADGVTVYGHPRPTLHEIVETLNLAFDKQKLLQRILEIAVATAGGDSGSIMLLDESGEFLRIVVSEGLSSEVVHRTRQRIGDGVAGRVLLEGRARILVDKLNDARYMSGRERTAIKAAVSAPIRIGGRTVGVINVSSDARPNVFTEETIGQMEQFGGEVAGVLLRAMQPASGGERALERSLESAIESLMTLDQPLDRRLEAIVEKLATSAGASAARLYLLDGTGRRLDVCAEFGPTSPGGRRAGIMADRGLPARAMARVLPTICSGDLGPDGIRALVYLPLSGQGPLGLLEIEDLPAGGPDWNLTVEALTTAARRLASQLELERSRRLLARRTRQMLLLSDMAGEFMNQHSAEELAGMGVRGAAELLAADLAVLRRHDGEPITLSHPEFVLGDPAGQRLIQFDGEFGDLALDRGRSVTLDQAPLETSGRLTGDAGVSWAAAVPLEGSAGPIGVLTVYTRQLTVPSPEHEELSLLERLAAQLVRAYDRLESGRESAGRERFMRWTLFQERVAEEMKRADRYGRSFGLTVIELGGFRAVGERMGHHWLEAARYVMADFVLSQVREVDLPCWVRDGRIAILTPESNDLEGMLPRRLADEWRKLVPSLMLEGLDSLEVTAGELLYPHDNRSWESCIDWLSDRFGEAEAQRRAG